MAICKQCSKEFKVGIRRYMVQDGWRKKLFCCYDCRSKYVKRVEEANKFLEDYIKELKG